MTHEETEQVYAELIAWAMSSAPDELRLDTPSVHVRKGPLQPRKQRPLQEKNVQHRSLNTFRQAKNQGQQLLEPSRLSPAFLRFQWTSSDLAMVLVTATGGVVGVCNFLAWIVAEACTERHHPWPPLSRN